MRPPATGEVAPPFDLPASAGTVISLARYRGVQPVVVLFYPGDFTPICTREMCAFRDTFSEFSRLGAAIVAISTDPPESHRRFQKAHALPFPLLSDERGHVSRRYGVLGLFGRRAKRASFVIDREGVVRYAKVQLPVFRPSVQEIAAVLTGLRREEEEPEGAGGGPGEPDEAPSAAGIGGGDPRP